MIWKYIKITLACLGAFVGAWLMILSLTVKLESPLMNNATLILGFVLGGGSILYLLIKIIGRLSK